MADPYSLNRRKLCQRMQHCFVPSSLKRIFWYAQFGYLYFVSFQLLNEPGLVAGIDPGMALTPFPSSIGCDSNPRPSNRETNLLTTGPDYLSPIQKDSYHVFRSQLGSGNLQASQSRWQLAQEQRGLRTGKRCRLKKSKQIFKTITYNFVRYS